MQVTTGSEHPVLINGMMPGLTTANLGGNLPLPMEWVPSPYEDDSERVKPTGRGQVAAQVEEAAWASLAAQARSSWASDNPF